MVSPTSTTDTHGDLPVQVFCPHACDCCLRVPVPSTLHALRAFIVWVCDFMFRTNLGVVGRHSGKQVPGGQSEVVAVRSVWISKKHPFDFVLVARPLADIHFCT